MVPFGSFAVLTFDSREHISLLVIENEVLFFQRFDEAYVPSLRLVQKCSSFRLRLANEDPDTFSTVQVNRSKFCWLAPM
jgi:predicted ribosome-associated RNA-binding protein Tma20